MIERGDRDPVGATDHFVGQTSRPPVWRAAGSLVRGIAGNPQPGRRLRDREKGLLGRDDRSLLSQWDPHLERQQSDAERDRTPSEADDHLRVRCLVQWPVQMAVQ